MKQRLTVDSIGQGMCEQCKEPGPEVAHLTVMGDYSPVVSLTLCFDCLRSIVLKAVDMMRDRT